YFIAHDQPIYENPSPGNKAGGITTLVHGKAMPQVLEEFVDLIVDIANGKQTCNERNDFRELAIFKSGVTL
ncbi:hypothetical protein CJ207_27925, partial [Klebsiella aerogenes]